MSVVVRIPTPLRQLTAGLGEVEAAGCNVAEVIDHLNGSYPGMAERLYRGGNELSRFVSIFVNGQDIRLLEGPATVVKEGDVVTILPLVSGG